jgi:hypothetical protein
MRRKATVQVLEQFMQQLAAGAQSRGKVYLTGGATALLLGFRDQTIEIDLKLDPEPQGVFEAIARLKNSLDINVELDSPDDFIPPRRLWREHSRHIATIGKVEFFHYDFALQALSKIERSHSHDLQDVSSFLRNNAVTTSELREVLKEIEPLLIWSPAIDPQRFKLKVETFVANYERSPGH